MLKLMQVRINFDIQVKTRFVNYLTNEEISMWNRAYYPAFPNRVSHKLIYICFILQELELALVSNPWNQPTP